MIEALRQPLENGDVTVARRDESVTLPARGMVVLACNPCPCGDWSARSEHNQCSCRDAQRRDYRNKVTGPVADRVDIVRHLPPLKRHDKRLDFEPPESTAAVRARVEAARARQAERYAGESWRLNGHAPGPVLRDRWPLTKPGQAMVDEQLYKGRLSRRGATRVHRLAWTVADLRGLEAPGLAEAQAALLLRTGEPLLLRMLERAG